MITASRRRSAMRGAAGFTILEIMIATAILTLGLVGILALFPVAIHYGKQIVERSTAVVIAESVGDAIRQGIRNNLRGVTTGGTTHNYFIFKHDGVIDPIPGKQNAESADKDYYILLPRFKAKREGLFSSRPAADRLAKTFVYPETDDNSNGGGNAFNADDDGDDYRRRLPSGEERGDILVQKTYKLGNVLPGDGATGESVLEDQKIEALKQYSYAFEIQASHYDANLDWSQQRYQPGNRLYRVRILVYRGFQPPSPDAKPVDPVFDLDFEVSI